MNRDKLLHLGGGALVAAAVWVLVHIEASFGVGWAAFAGAALAGIAFEAQQQVRGEGKASWRDALATAAGGAVVALILGIA